MEWLLGISVVLNILLSLVIAALIYAKLMADVDSQFARGEWAKWEKRFHMAQGKLLDEHNLFISTTGGEYGEMSIKKKGE